MKCRHRDLITIPRGVAHRREARRRVVPADREDVGVAGGLRGGIRGRHLRSRRLRRGETLLHECRLRRWRWGNIRWVRLKHEHPAAVAVAVVAGRREVSRADVRKGRTGDVAIDAVRRVEPVGHGRRAQLRHIHRELPDDRRVDHHEISVRRARRREVIITRHVRRARIHAVAGDDDGVIRVRHQIEPRARLEKRLHESELNRARRIEMRLPSARKRPRVAVAIKLPGRTARHRPIVLFAQDWWSGHRTLQAFEFVVRLDHEVRQEIRARIILLQSRVGREIRVGSVQPENRIPVRIVERTAHEIVQFDRVQVSGVVLQNPQCHLAHHGIIARISPALKIVPAHPGDVREVPVSVPEESPVGAAARRAVGEHHAQKTARLARIEQHLDPVLRREIEHAIHVREISLVRRRQIVRARRRHRPGERENPVERAAVGASPRIGGAEEIDPDRVETERGAISEKHLRLRFGKVHH